MSLQAESDQLKSIESMQSNKDKKERASRANQEDIIFHQWATFKVNKELYGIDVMKVKEVLRYSDMTPVPGAEHYILGIINLRGNVATVLDTRRLFKMPIAEIDDNTRIIMVDYNEQEVVGLVVDSVDEVINIPQDDIERAPNIAGEESSRRFVQGVCYHNELLTILLDINKMMVSITPDTEDDSH
jgi:purine-binding chemotaxis protein CheW